MFSSSRSAVALVALLMFAALGLVVTPAPAAPRAGESLDDARAAYEAAQARATEAAGRHEAAVSRFYELEGEIGALEDQLAATEARAEELRVVARERAVEAYTGGRVDLAGTLETEDVLDVARMTTLLDQLKAEDDDKLELLRALDEDLARKREDLDALRAEQEEAVAALEEEQAAIEAEAADAQTRYAELEEQERRERERQERERRAAEAARAAAEERASREAANTSTSTTAATSPTAAPAAPAPASSGGSPGGTFNIVCPVPGSSFVDSWGAARSTGGHQGVDMMAGIGTPNYAVVSGTASPRSMGIGGYGVALAGDDGNLYYYIHGSPGTGVSGHVSQGQFVMSGGDSGNAAGAPHTHFEIHPGHGPAINPYPHVAAVC